MTFTLALLSHLCPVLSRPHAAPFYSCPARSRLRPSFTLTFSDASHLARASSLALAFLPFTLSPFPSRLPPLVLSQLLSLLLASLAIFLVLPCLLSPVSKHMLTCISDWQIISRFERLFHSVLPLLYYLASSQFCTLMLSAPPPPIPPHPSPFFEGLLPLQFLYLTSTASHQLSTPNGRK